MATQSNEISFIVPGQALPAGHASTTIGGTTRSAVRVGARRGGGEAVRVTARPDEDIVLLHIANGPTLYLHPEDARDLLRAQVGGVAQSRGGATLAGDVVVVPAQLGWRGLGTDTATRGKLGDWLGGVVLDALEVVTGLTKDKAVDLASMAVTRKLDGQVEAGVYTLSARELGRLKGSGKKQQVLPTPPKPEDPLLVLVHGTFVDTASTFGKLWELHPQRVRALFEHYGGRVYALDHPTVGVNPFANALTLVRALPKGARLHLVTHSRGGIVAEVLARLCGGQGQTPSDLALFKKDAYASHRADLTALAKEIQERDVKVERLVRVACPARGTLLASRRLDSYLSVLKWGLELARVPVIPALVDFLAEVARRKGDPAELPGLEAMMPGRPVAQWLNAAAEPVPGDLRVVAGDIEGDSLLSWLKTLLSDAFYWTDNDLVVQTRSMYGGTPRAAGAASFVLDRGGKVTHFNYFANESTVDCITRGLMQDRPDGFRPIGPLSWAGEDASGIRAAQRPRAGNAAERPAVFVLPGILGSHLKVDGQRVWLSLRAVNGLARLRWDPSGAARVQPDGPMGMSYDDLIDHLAESHEVIPFGFDWRRPIEDEARRLADAVDSALAARNATQQPVRILAHSMGGLVARTMQLERPETWKRMMSRAGARLLMLGTPNGGSFAPMQVLSGDDTFGNLLSVFGSLFDGQAARQMFAEMPGFLQLQAGLVGRTPGLDEEATWQKLAQHDVDVVRGRQAERSWWHNDVLQIDSLRWGVPPQKVLDQAVALRKRLDAQAETLGADASKIVQVVGKARFTPVDVLLEETGVVYLDSPADGDGRVTLVSASLPGVRVWQADAAHGDLASAKRDFAAYVELLVTGDTVGLPRATLAGSARGATDAPAPTLVPNRPAHTMLGNEPPAALSDVFAVSGNREDTTRSTGARLRVTVVNGNLKFVHEPLLLGHYQSLKLTGTEWVIDRLLGNAMSEALDAGLYPTRVGSNHVFMNSARNPDDPFVLPRPKAAIVVGLGDEGSLRLSNLIETVRQGVLCYAQRVGESRGGGATTFELAATLIGSGGSSMSAGMAAQALVIGVREANDRLEQVGWAQVAHLQLIELYLDRATEALLALSALGELQAPGMVLEPQIKLGLGGLKRPADSGYRSTDYDFISVHKRGHGNDIAIEFALDTRRARDEVRGLMPQSKLIDELVRVGATDSNTDAQIGRTLFKLLVPLEIEQFLSGSSSLMMRLDPRTAVYPWELLDALPQTTGPRHDKRPWAVRTRLLRKLRTEFFREAPHDAGIDGEVLVIGEPQCPTELYPRLPGAVAEARAVAKVFGVQPVLNEDALAIVNAVLDRSYRVLHVAGHGDFVGGIGGVVLSNGATFGPREVKAMRTVPALAFINCCHLGRFDGDPPKKVSPLGGRLPDFAANVAEELIKIGVRCVVAAGWAVHDEPAELFARSFYQELVKGRSFVEAVGTAREMTWSCHPESNTWAAYQCYGDPDWTFRSHPDAAPKPRRLPDVPSADALIAQLEALVAAHAYEDRKADLVRSQVEQLDAAHGGAWGRRGAVAAAFGDVYAEIGDFERAVEWYGRALAAEDGGATLRAMERLGNARVRRGAKVEDLDAARKEVGAGIELLEHVVSLAPTSERLALLASAWKRLANVEERANKTGKRRENLKKALDQYREAERIARDTGADNLFYPAMCRMSIELVLGVANAAPMALADADLSAVRQSLQKKNDGNPDFWSVIGATELRIYEALAARGLGPALTGILADLDDLIARSTSIRMWSSAADQARFVLQPYSKSPELPKTECEAALQLLARFEREVAPAAEKSAGQRKSAARKPRTRKSGVAKRSKKPGA